MSKARDIATQGGLVLLASRTMNGTATSEYFTNIFSSKYTNYKVMVSANTPSVDGYGMYIQFGNGGTPNADANYQQAGMWSYAGYSGSGTSLASASTAFLMGPARPTYKSAGFAEIFSPYENTYTNYNTMWYDGNGYAYWHSGIKQATTSYSDLRIYNSYPANVYGTISVYGYRNQ